MSKEQENNKIRSILEKINKAQDILDRAKAEVISMIKQFFIMKQKEKLERAGWVFKEYTTYEKFERNGEVIYYDTINDTIVFWEMENRSAINDTQLEILFDK